MDPNIIGVRFTKVGKIYHFDSTAVPNIGLGEHVIVDTSRGRHLGEVVQVVKEVPPGATAVGNPAHIVQKDAGKQREEAAARVFAAYGVTLSADEDPLSTALHKLIDHAVAQEEQMQRILAALQAAGVGCEILPQKDKFDAEQLNKLVE